MTDKARIAAAGAMNNVRTAIDSAKRIGFNGNTVSPAVFCPCVCLLAGRLCTGLKPQGPFCILHR